MILTHPCIALLLKWQPKGDVVTQGEVLAPWVLGDKGHSAADLSSASHWLHVAQDGMEQGRLASTNTPHNSHQLTRGDIELWHVQDEVVLAVVLVLSVALGYRNSTDSAAGSMGGVIQFSERTAFKQSCMSMVLDHAE